MTTVKVSRRQVPHKKIVEYWGDKLNEIEFNFDFSEAIDHCWSCGYFNKKLEASHIIPHCLGGESIPSNLVLLCRKCNLANPHCRTQEDFFNWLRSKRKMNIYGLYNTSRIYEINIVYKQLYGKDIFEEVCSLFKNSNLSFEDEFTKYKSSQNDNYYFGNYSTFAVYVNSFINHVKNKIENI